MSANGRTVRVFFRSRRDGQSLHGVVIGTTIAGAVTPDDSWPQAPEVGDLWSVNLEGSDGMVLRVTPVERLAQGLSSDYESPRRPHRKLRPPPGSARKTGREAGPRPPTRPQPPPHRPEHPLNDRIVEVTFYGSTKVRTTVDSIRAVPCNRGGWKGPLPKHRERWRVRVLRLTTDLQLVILVPVRRLGTG